MHSHPSPAAQPGISLATEVAQSANLLSTLVGEDVVIFDLGQDRYFSLGPTGTSVWQRLEQPMTVAALCDALVLEYDAPRATIEEDVLALLTDMAKGGLVRI